MWETVKLGDVVDISIGKTPSRSEKKYWDKDKVTNNVWLSIADLNAVKDGFVSDSKEYISDEGASLFKPVPANTLIMSFKLSIGKLAFTARNLRTNEAIAALVIKDSVKLLNEYLKHYLSSLNWDDIAGDDVKVKGKTLNKAKLKEIPVIIPPLTEQQRILAKLDAAFAEIDDTVESLRIKALECDRLVSSMISKVMRKYQGNEATSSLLGEQAYTAGRIGWKGLTKKEYVEQGYLFLSVHGLNYGKYVDFRDAFRITKDRYDESPEIMLKQGDVLLCKDGAGIGKLGIVGKLHEPATINSSLLLIRPNINFSSEYIYYYLLAPDFQSIIQTKIDGATTPHLYQRDIKQLPIIYPEKRFQEQAVREIEAALHEINMIRETSVKNTGNYLALKSAILRQELQQSEAA